MMHDVLLVCMLYVISLECMQGSWRGSEALWIVMEYCGGGSVADLMHASDAPLDQDMIAYICAETLAGLTYLHSIGKVCFMPSLSTHSCHVSRLA